MIRLIISFMLMSLSFNLYASHEAWTTSFKDKAPSCPLYRKRVLNYYNRLNELELISQIFKKDLTNDDFNRYSEIWNRASIPLSLNETATWSTEVYIGDWAHKITNQPISAKITSDLITWHTDTFIFPEETLRLKVDQERKMLKIEVEMQYLRACMKDTEILMEFFQGEERVGLKFRLSKYGWDLVH